MNFCWSCGQSIGEANTCPYCGAFQTVLSATEDEMHEEACRCAEKEEKNEDD